MSQLPDNIIERLHSVATGEGFTDFTLVTKPGSKHGDNFLGEIFAITITGKRMVNAKLVDDRLDVVCKIAPQNQFRREHFKAEIVFTREAFIYNKLLPTFLEFQKKKGLKDEDCFMSFPKCYVAIADKETDEYLVIMKDLRADGYEMWSKSRPVTARQCQLLVQELAKLHAISFAMKDQEPEVFDQFKKLHDVSRKLFLKKNTQGFLVKNYAEVQKYLDNDQHRGILEEFKNNLVPYFEDCLTEDDRSAKTITHGDCWNNNILYHYNKNGNKTPDNICLIDWQLTRYSSPVLDLHYNLSSSTDKQLRDEHYANLMDLYYSTLSKTIEKLGSNPEKLFSYDDFQNELKKYGNFAYLMSPILVRMCLTDPEDVINLDEYSEKSAKGENAVNLVTNNLKADVEARYKERMVDLINDLVRYGYYRKIQIDAKL